MHRCIIEEALSHCKCCHARRCRDAGCHISMPGGNSRRAILAGTSYQTNHAFNGPLCDFIVFLCTGDDHAYVLELKGAASVSLMSWTSYRAEQTSSRPLPTARTSDSTQSLFRRGA